MSRSGYTDDCEDNWAHIRWRGAVASAIRGKRGQQFLKEVLAALDAMPEKRLAATRFDVDGDFCTLGAVCHRRGMDVTDLSAKLTPEDENDYQDDVSNDIAVMLDIPRALAAEVMWENDEAVSEYKWVTPPTLLPSLSHWHRDKQRDIRIGVPDVAERRWRYMRDWVTRQISVSASPEPQSAIQRQVSE